MRKSATKEPKLVKKGQNFALSMLKSTPARKKSTPPPVVAVVTNMSYAQLHLLSTSVRHISGSPAIQD